MRTAEAEIEFVATPTPGGNPCFQMGSTDPLSKSTERPVHEVCLKVFELGKFEVTQRDWRLVMLPVLHLDPSYFKTGDANGASWKDAGWPARLLSFFGRYEFKNDKLPVENVSWNDVKTFLWLMNVFGRHNYRLPSEAEWSTPLGPEARQRGIGETALKTRATMRTWRVAVAARVPLR